MLQFEEPARMQVLHPKFGKVEVKAYCVVDAKMQANGYWPEADWGDMQVYVENKALERACGGVGR